MKLGALVRLGRPQFLVGGLLLYGLGAAIAARAGHAIDGTRYVLGQLAVTALHWMTHYANDYFDYEADCANPTPTRWSGGSRVLQAQLLARRTALGAALVLAAAGVAASCVLVAHGAPPWTAPTLAVTLVLAWEYSAPPLRLCATGTGEVVTAFVVTGLVPWLGFYLQAPELRGVDTLILAVVPLTLLQIAMLLAIELADAAGDAAAGKRTLVVRLGPDRAARLYALLTAAAFAWLPLAAWLGLPARVAVAAALLSPFAAWRIARVADHRDPRAREAIGASAVWLLVATAVAELVAVIV